MNSLIENLTIIGIVLTGLFASIGYFYKNYMERKKVIKHVLYNYLEMREVLEKRYFPEEEIRLAYKEYIEKKGLIAEEQFIQSAFNDVLIKLKEIDINISSDFVKQLRNSLIELSKVDPIFAFHLTNKETAFDIIDNLKDDENTYNQELFKFVLLDLNDDILSISRKVNYLTYLRVKSILNINRIEAVIDFVDSSYGDIFSQLVVEQKALEEYTHQTH